MCQLLKKRHYHVGVAEQSSTTIWEFLNNLLPCVQVSCWTNLSCENSYLEFCCQVGGEVSMIGLLPWG
jgi:hypothetical protein